MTRTEHLTRCGAPLPRTSPATGHSFCWWPRQPLDLRAAATGRRWVRQALPRLLSTAPAASLGETVDLLLTEMITNAVEHGGGVREVRITGTAGWLRLEVRDESPLVPVLRTDGDIERGDGRGMVLIEAFAERWGVRPCGVLRGKYVWADLPLDRPGPAAPADAAQIPAPGPLRPGTGTAWSPASLTSRRGCW